MAITSDPAKYPRRPFPASALKIVGVGAGIAALIAATLFDLPRSSRKIAPAVASTPPASVPYGDVHSMQQGKPVTSKMRTGKPANGTATPELYASVDAAGAPDVLLDAKQPQAANPFGGATMVIPKPPPSANPGSPAGFIGPITAHLDPVKTADPKKTPNPRPGDLYLRKLIAHGLPAAPAAIKPTTVATAPAITAVRPEATLVSLELLAKDASAAWRAIGDAAQKLGGRTQPLIEKGITGGLVLVPAASLDDFLRGLATFGAVSGQSSWTGSPDNRAEKLEERAVARLDSLKKLREALLTSYKADAGIVKDTDGDIADAQAVVDQLRLDGADEKTAVIRIAFTPSPS